MAHDVFISHATQDKTIADSVCAALEASGIRCWIAPRDVQPGRSFAGEITRAIRASRAMILIFSANSNNSEQVLREVQLAVEAHLHIIQFRIEEVTANDDLKYYLSTPHWLDALSRPLKRHLDRLVASIQALLSQQPGGMPPPHPIQPGEMPQPLSPVADQTKPKPKRFVAALLAAVVLIAICAAAIRYLKKPTAAQIDRAPNEPSPASRIVDATPSPTAALAETASATVAAAENPSPSPATPVVSSPVNQKKAQVYFDRAANSRKRSDPQFAIVQYDVGLALDPTNGNAYLMRALLKHQQGDFDGALTDYEQALKYDLSTLVAVAHEGLANVYRDEEKFDEAATEYERALELNARDVSTYSDRAILKMLQGDAHGALVDHNRALEIDPKNLLAHEALAEFYLTTRQWTEAIATINKVIALDPTHEPYSRFLIWVADSHRNVFTADRELANFVAERKRSYRNDWNSYIGDFLVGKVPEEDFVSAKSVFFLADKRRLCQSCYFAGIKHLVHNDKTGGIERLHQAIATPTRGAMEYRLARAELKYLGK